MKGTRKVEGKELKKSLTDTQVILYSVQCYALHWTDNENGRRERRRKEG